MHRLVAAASAAALLAGTLLTTSAPAFATGPGTVLSWGSNASGQLGTPGPSSVTPGIDPGLLGVKAVAAGRNHTLALMNDGTVRAWGANDRGQLGNGTQDASSTPVVVSGLSNVTAIAAGDVHSLALTSDGLVYAWGEGNNGQLGNGLPVYPPKSDDGGCFLYIVGCWISASGLAPDDIYLTIPTAVLDLSNVTAIAAGAAHSLAVRDDGSVWAWGSDDSGQLGAGAIAFQNASTQPGTSLGLVPVGGNTTPADRLTGITAVAAGGHHSLALGSDGQVYSWGSNATGQLGSTRDVSPECVCRVAPGLVTGVTGTTAIAAGWAHSLSLSMGGAWAWGDNSRGQIGDGSGTNRPVPVNVGPPSVDLAGPVSIAAGAFHSLLLTNSFALTGCPQPCFGVIYAWGADEAGQLGDSGTRDRPTPAKITALSDVTAIAGGLGHTVALGGRPVGIQPIFPTDPAPGITVDPNRPGANLEPPIVVGPELPTFSPTATSASSGPTPPPSPFKPFVPSPPAR